jgi:imidazoleglycerol-phosphate dehydratase
MQHRMGKITRNTKETNIELSINLDECDKSKIDTGIGFLDHMLELFTLHGLFSLNVKAKGDIHVDYHHTVEDIGICLGMAIHKALEDMKGVKRYGYCCLPMDEALVAVVVDISRRGMLVFNVNFQELSVDLDKEQIKKFDVELIKEFFRAFAVNAGITLHINLIYGDNSHHIIEAIFKATARALRDAVDIDARIGKVLSTKGAI